MVGTTVAARVTGGVDIQSISRKWLLKNGGHLACIQSGLAVLLMEYDLETVHAM